MRKTLMPIYNLIEYSDNYLKASWDFWQYCRDEPAVDDNNGNIVKFADNSATDSFKLKKKTLTGKTGNHDKKDAETMVPLKYLRRRQFNLLVYEQDSIKNSIGRQAKQNVFFLFIRVDNLERKIALVDRQSKSFFSYFLGLTIWNEKTFSQ